MPRQPLQVMSSPALDPLKELELARTALKLGWPLDIERIIDLAERALNSEFDDARDYHRGYAAGYNQARRDG